MKNKLTVFLSAVLMSFSTSAFSFEGFSVGATYSNIDYSTSGKESHSNGAAAVSTITSTTKNGSADVGSIFAEYTFSQGSTIGIDYISGSAEIGKATSTARTSAAPAGSNNSSADGSVTASATVKDPLTIYFEPTWMANDKFGLFLKGGITSVTVSPKENADAGSVTTSTYTDKDLYGRMMGVGAKYYMGNFFVKAEYVETDFDTYAHQSTTGDKNTITADIDTEETRLSIGYNF